MNSPQDLLADLVIRRRAEVGIATTKALGEKTGISTRTLSDVENGKRSSYSSQTLWALDEALRWKKGSAHSILIGVAAEPQLVEEENESIDKFVLIEALDLEPGRLEGLSAADIQQVEMVARLAASKEAGELQARNRELLGNGQSMETVRRDVDTRSTTNTRQETEDKTR